MGLSTCGVPSKEDGSPNLNHAAYVRIGRAYQRSALVVLRRRPGVYLDRVRRALRTWLRPPTDYILVVPQREALRGAEIELARKRNELAALTKQALDLERQLVLKRTEPTETSASGTDSVRIARVLIDLEKATLEAQKKAADKQSEVADGARSVVGRQLKTLHARQNIYSGK